MCYATTLADVGSSLAQVQMRCDAANAFGPRDEIDEALWLYDDLDNNIWRKPNAAAPITESQLGDETREEARER